MSLTAAEAGRLQRAAAALLAASRPSGADTGRPADCTGWSTSDCTEEKKCIQGSEGGIDGLLTGILKPLLSKFTEVLQLSFGLTSVEYLKDESD